MPARINRSKNAQDPIEPAAKKLNCSFVPGSNTIMEEVANQLTQYFKESLRKFSIPLKWPGSNFQQIVWHQLQMIPYGATRSCKEQALQIENDKAVRAVARANGDNRIAIIIPCHRVIGSDGSLTGYGGRSVEKEAPAKHGANLFIGFIKLTCTIKSFRKRITMKDLWICITNITHGFQEIYGR